MRKRLSLFLAFIMCIGTMTSGFGTAHWASSQIQRWLSNGWISYYDRNTFQPNGYITRAEFASLVNHAFGFSIPSDKNFADVSNYSWYAEDVKIGVQAGYINGFSETVFSPESKIKREDVATIISRIMVLGNDVYPQGNKISDYYSVTEYARAPVSQVIRWGFMNGYPGGKFKPKGYLTQAEAIVLLDRMVGKELKAFDIYGEERQTILRGNYYISSEEFHMKNTTIKGNLIVRGTAKEGQLIFEDVHVEGDMFLFGGGDHSVTLLDTKVRNLHANKPVKPIRIVMDGYAEAQKVYLGGNSILEEKGDKLYGFSKVELFGESTSCMVVESYIEEIKASNIDKLSFSPKVTVEKCTMENDKQETKVTGQGEVRLLDLSFSGSGIVSFDEGLETLHLSGENSQIVLEKTIKDIVIKDKVDLECKPKTKIRNMVIEKDAQVFLTMGTDTIVGTMRIDGKTDVRGEGIVENAIINTKDVAFQKKPESYQVASSISLNLDGNSLVGKTKKVEKIILESNKEDMTTISINQPVQYTGKVYPSDATNKELTWEIVPITGEATVNSLGIVTATKEGDIWLKVTAKDGSGITKLELVHVGTGVDTEKVQQIAVFSEDNLATITMNMRLQMDVKFFPENVKDKTVTWKVIGRTGKAEIDSKGELLGLTEGIVDVIALANDGTGVMGTKQITIKGQADTKAPSIFGLTQYNINKGGVIELSSTEDGYIYFVPGNTQNSEAAFLQAIADKKALKEKALANKIVKIDTSSLEAGEYKAYAMDRTGNLSDPSQLVTIDSFDNRTVITAIKDYNLSNTLSDLEVQFAKAQNESQLSEYRLFITNSNEVGAITAQSLAGYTSDFYTVVPVSGLTKYSTKLKSVQKAVGANPVVSTGPYRVLILSVSKDTFSVPNQLSLPSAIVNVSFGDGTVADTKNPVLIYARLVDDFAAKSDESGTIYFVPATTQGTKMDLEASIAANTGRKVSCVENEEVTLDVTGLANGLYIAYAMDASDNLSVPSAMIEINKIINTATLEQILDLNYQNNLTDIVVQFAKAPDESLVKNYKIMIVPSALTGVFNVASAGALSQDLSMYVAKTGNAQYRVRLNAGMLDISRVPISTGNSYKVFVFTESLDGKTDQITSGYDFTPNFTDGVKVMNLSGLSTTRILPGQTLTVTSNTKGTIFMVPYEVQNSYAAISAAAASPLASRTIAVEEGATVTLDPTGVIDNRYKLVLIDDFQNVSAPTEAIYVTATQNIPNITGIVGDVGLQQATLNFQAAPNEVNIFQYKAVLVPTAQVPRTYQEMILITDGNSVLISKTGGATYSVTIPNTTLDYQGNPLIVGSQYTVYLLSVPDGVNAKVIQISTGQNYQVIN